MQNLATILEPLRGNADDLFICASKDGTMCRRVPGELAINGSYRAKNSLLIVYHDPIGPGERLHRKRLEQFNIHSELNAEWIRRTLSDSAMNSNAGVLNFSRRHSSSNVHDFHDFLKSKSLEGVIGNVTVDITSLNDEDVFSILYTLDRPGNLVRLLYGEPPAGTLPASEGIVLTSTVPHFHGDHQSSSTSRHVAVFLSGYDSGKLYAIEDHMRSRDTYMVYPKPSLHKGWDSHSKRLNANIARFVRSKDVHEVSEANPVAVRDTLQKIHSSYPIGDPDYEKRWFMGIGLAGCTKWPVVGAYLFVRGTVKKFDRFEHSPIAVYYSAAVFDRPLNMDRNGFLRANSSRISEYVFLGGSSEVVAHPGWFKE